MRKVMLSVVAGLLAASVVLPATAGEPGSGTMPAQSAFGLCTAYFAGSSTGQDHKHNAPPFQDLQAKADQANKSVADFCESQTPGNK